MITIEITSTLKILFLISVLCTVFMSEMVKKFDIKDKLKGYKIWLPFIFGGIFTMMMKLALNIEWKILPFYFVAIFGTSVFGYEFIVKNGKKIFKKYLEKKLEESLGIKQELDSEDK